MRLQVTLQLFTVTGHHVLLFLQYNLYNYTRYDFVHCWCISGLRLTPATTGF